MPESTIILWRRIPSQNQRDRWHWRVRDRDKQAFLVELLAVVGRTHTRPTVARSVLITSHRAQLITDHGNLVGGAKGLVDAIVYAGLLVDDADQWADITYDQVNCKRIDEHTAIIIKGFEPVVPLNIRPKPLTLKKQSKKPTKGT